ncbi:unnamed protein product [Paramecium octaurelia]|uniref:Ion transport domain-containing protein n=1 Tax=Paramecium octaurelia TaxID=43137 RepID=A0A8S1V8J5_PAROT|nr:unnamed protein product [Paramecium octaurelia]
MIFQQLKITLPPIGAQEIEKSIQKRMGDCLETQLGFEYEPFTFQYLELHPDLVTIKNQKIEHHPIEDQKHVQTSLGCFSKENKIRIFLCENIHVLQRLVIIMVIVNTIAFCLYDYQIRDSVDNLSSRNIASITIETICNAFFGIEIIIQCICYGAFFGKGTYLRNIWSCLNFLTFVCTWSIYFDQSITFIQLLRVIRLLRLVRLLQEIQYFRERVESFFSCFLTIHTIIIPVVIVIFGFSVIGLHLLRGVTGRRCAKNGIIDLNIRSLCGEWECPDGYECIDQFNSEDLNYLDFYYGYYHFDTIYDSFLSGFMFFNATGWSPTTFYFWKAVTPPATAIYFIFMLFILHYTLSDLLLATLYESFLVSSAIKNSIKSNKSELFTQRRRTVTLINNQNKAQINFHKLHMITQISSQNRVNLVAPAEILSNETLKEKEESCIIARIKQFDQLLIIASTVVLCIDQVEKRHPKEYYADMIMNFLIIILTLLKLIFFKKSRRKLYIIVDVILSICLIAVIILEFLNFQSNVFIIIKAFKAFRVIKLIYKVEYFGVIRLLLRCLIETIIKIRHLIILWVIFAFLISIIGQELFAHYVQGSTEIEIHFNGIGNSLMAVFNIFYAEEWHVTMYQHALYKPVSSFIFFLIVFFLSHTLFMRLLRALFLNEFGKKLNELDQKYPQTDYLQRAWQYIKTSWFQQESAQSSSQSQNEDDSKAPLQEISQKGIPVKPNNSQNKGQIYRRLVEHKLFRICLLLVVGLSAVKSAVQNPLTDPHSQEKMILDVIQYVTTAIFMIELILNCVAYGIIKFISQSFLNILSIINIIVNIISIGLGNPPLFILTLFDSLRVLSFLKTGADQYPILKQALQALFNAFTKMIQLALFSLLILLMYSLIGMQLLNDQFYYCSLPDGNASELHLKSKIDCFDIGGSWINRNLNFDTLFESINLLFCVATSEEWIPLMSPAWNAAGIDKQPHHYTNRYWSIYYQLFFFIGNTLVLGMFVTLVVETYIKTREESQNLHLLDDKQREWFQIKEQILHLKPKKKFKPPTIFILNILYRLNQYLQIPFLIVILSNIIILSLYYARMEAEYEQALDQVNQVFIFIQLFEILITTVQVTDYKFKIYEICGILLSFVSSFLDYHILHVVSVAFQVTRIYKLTQHFKTIQHLFHAIFAVLPNTASMLLIMLVVLYCYTIVSCDLFAYLRPQSSVNGFDMHFRDFWGALMTLIKVSTGEKWWIVMQETTLEQSPAVACINIESYEEFQEIGFNGCGSNLSYPFFISFILVFSLMILNLLVANILGAYEQYHKSEQSAISKYQLLDVMELWSQFDEDGEGFISYKLFWRLSSQIAIIFGLEQSDLLDVNNKKKFLKALKIPIYELVDSNVLCYRFHDVIVSLTRISVTIKYGVVNLEPVDKDIHQKVYGNKYSQVEPKFRETTLNSGDMVSIIFIQQKFREWKQRSLLKNTIILGGIGDYRSLIKIKSKTLSEKIHQQMNNEN